MTATDALAGGTRTVELPSGVKHHSTSAVALSWEAFDALTEDDGWRQRQWCVDADSKQVPCGTPGSHVHLHKEATIIGCRIVVFPPHVARPEPDPCPDCHGTGSVARSNGVFMRCGRCYGWAK